MVAFTIVKATISAKRNNLHKRYKVCIINQKERYIRLLLIKVKKNLYTESIFEKKYVPLHPISYS